MMKISGFIVDLMAHEHYHQLAAQRLVETQASRTLDRNCHPSLLVKSRVLVDQSPVSLDQRMSY